MNILLYLTLFLYFFLPFQFALNPMADFDIAIIRIFIIIIIFFYLCISLFKKYLFIPIGWTFSFFTAFSMFTLFSLFFSPVPFWTIRKLLFLFSFYPILLILTTLFYSLPLAKERIIKITVLGATIISIIGLMQFFSQFIFNLNTILSTWSLITPFFLGNTFAESVITNNSWLVNIGGHTIMRAIAFFPDPHIFSFYLGLIIPLAIGLFFTTQNKYWLLTFLILLLTDLLTFSRGGYIGLFGGLLISIILVWPIIKTSLKHFILFFLISFFLILLIPHNPITSRFLSSFDTTDKSNIHRIELWTQSYQKISQRPLLGTGLGAYSYTINPTATYRTPIYIHNIFLDIVAELGFIGLFLFISTFISAIIILYKNKTDYIALFSIVSLTIFFFHSLFDTPIFSVHVFPILLLILAISINYENPKTTK
jgi:O-antigen ligase